MTVDAKAVHDARMDEAGQERVTAYVTIGNSDDRLTQADWSDLHAEVLHSIQSYATQIWGVWSSESASPYQNACIGFEIKRHLVRSLQIRLGQSAARYGQESVAWVDGQTTMIEGVRR